MNEENIQLCNSIKEKVLPIMDKCPKEQWNEVGKIDPLLVAQCGFALAVSMYIDAITNPDNKINLTDDELKIIQSFFSPESINNPHIIQFTIHLIFGRCLYLEEIHAFDRPVIRKIEPVDHWSWQDVLGCTQNYLNKVFNNDHLFNVSEIFELLNRKHSAISNETITLRSFKPFYDLEDDVIDVFRKPMWIECKNPTTFIEEFKKEHEDIPVVDMKANDFFSNPSDDMTLEGIVRKSFPNNTLHENYQDYLMATVSNMSGQGILFLHDIDESDESLHNLNEIITARKVASQHLASQWIVVFVTKHGRFAKYSSASLHDIYNQISYYYFSMSLRIRLYNGYSMDKSHVIDYMRTDSI